MQTAQEEGTKKIETFTSLFFNFYFASGANPKRIFPVSAS